MTKMTSMPTILHFIILNGCFSFGVTHKIINCRIKRKIKVSQFYHHCSTGSKIPIVDTWKSCCCGIPTAPIVWMVNVFKEWNGIKCDEMKFIYVQASCNSSLKIGKVLLKTFPKYTRKIWIRSIALLDVHVSVYFNFFMSYLFCFLPSLHLPGNSFFSFLLLRVKVRKSRYWCCCRIFWVWTNNIQCVCVCVDERCE